VLTAYPPQHLKTKKKNLKSGASECDLLCKDIIFSVPSFFCFKGGGGRKYPTCCVKIFGRCQDILVASLTDQLLDLPKENTPLKNISKEKFFNLLREDIFVASLTDQLLNLLHRCVWLHHLVEEKRKKGERGEVILLNCCVYPYIYIYIYIYICIYHRGRGRERGKGCGVGDGGEKEGGRGKNWRERLFFQKSIKKRERQVDKVGGGGGP
jgi:hypothetical protein